MKTEEIPGCDWLEYAGCKRDQLAAENKRLKEALSVCEQAIIEFSAAQERGPGWYTRGVDGMYAQIRLWLGKAFDAIREAKG